MEYIAQQLVDAAVWSQNEAGTIVGAWYYNPNSSNYMFHEGVPRSPMVGLMSARAMHHRGVYVNNLVHARFGPRASRRTLGQLSGDGRHPEAPA